jgi:uncharacterized protein YrrD
VNELIINIGAKVYCFEEECGVLHKVVIKNETKEITDMIVKKGILLQSDKVVPMSAVLGAGEEAVHLSVTEPELQQLPDYEDVVQVHRQQESTPLTDQIWRSGPGLFPPNPHAVATREQFHKGVPAGRMQVDRSTAVINLEGEIGKVGRLSFDPQTYQLTKIVVDRGLLAEAVTIPQSLVKEVDSFGIFVDAGEEILEMVSASILNMDQALLVGFQDEIAAAGLSLKGVDIDVSGGIMRLTGVVRSTAMKREIETIAQSIEGVIDVENALFTDTGIRARVISALERESPTEFAHVRVNCRFGVITLGGEVSEEDASRAAEEIAAQRPGVLHVVNRLEYQPDQNDSSLQTDAVLKTQKEEK